ncbi:MAG: response regulator transcription factor [Anaerolineaceae bacterium]|nr:response regulator transcription factor [Anaerolineaceae bacterium]
MSGKILVIEGKRAERTSFVGGLTKKGFRVISVPSGNAALNKLDKEQPDVIVIDADSMRTSGKRICQSLRSATSQTPIILILGNGVNEKDEFEADVIMHLPFTLQKLLNRIKVLLPLKSSNDVMKSGPIELDLTHRFVKVNEKQISLTPRLTRLLQALMQQPGQVFGRDDLFKFVWETDYIGDTRTLDVHVSWLRNLIEDDPRHPDFIKTVRGVGYRLDFD